MATIQSQPNFGELLDQITSYRDNRRLWERRGRISQTICTFGIVLAFLSAFVDSAAFSRWAQFVCLILVVVSWGYGWYCVRTANDYAELETGIQEKLATWETNDGDTT